MFLTMALMGLQLGTEGCVQLCVCHPGAAGGADCGYTLWIVFRFMGKDYEAAVLCAGFGGIALGSTSTAVANMSAVTRQYGAAHRAFIIVPWWEAFHRSGECFGDQLDVALTPGLRFTHWRNEPNAVPKTITATSARIGPMMPTTKCRSNLAVG